jgi:glutathione S-transferase
MVTIYSAPNTRAIRVIWVLEEIGAKADAQARAGLFCGQSDRNGAALDRRRGAAERIDGDLRLPCHQARLAADRTAQRPGATPVPAMAVVRRVDADDAIVASEHRGERKGPEVNAIIAGARDHVAERVKMLEERLKGRDFLVAGRLTLADISVSYPLHLVGMLGIDSLLGPRSVAYHERLRARPAHQRANAVS